MPQISKKKKNAICARTLALCALSLSLALGAGVPYLALADDDADELVLETSDVLMDIEARNADVEGTAEASEDAAPDTETLGAPADGVGVSSELGDENSIGDNEATQTDGTEDVEGVVPVGDPIVLQQPISRV